MFCSANILNFITGMEELAVFTLAREQIITISASDSMRKKVNEIIPRLYIGK